MSHMDANYPAEKLVGKITKKRNYTEQDRNAWMSIALGQIAPAGTWPMELFRDMYHAESPEKAIDIARNARDRFKALWYAFDPPNPQDQRAGHPAPMNPVVGRTNFEPEQKK